LEDVFLQMSEEDVSGVNGSREKRGVAEIG